jgi:predicted metalloprotease with PDZ domain
LNDLVKALNQVQPFDWAGFFRTRVYEVAPQVPVNGITQGGYKLVYNDTEPDAMKHSDPSRGAFFATSLGFSVSGTGDIDNVWWDSLAFKAGITPDVQLQAVNDQKYSAAVLRDAILAAEKTQDPIKLLLKRDDKFLTISLNYHGGMRYPHLERVESAPDLLDPILSPSK